MQEMLAAPAQSERQEVQNPNGQGLICQSCYNDIRRSSKSPIAVVDTPQRSQSAPSLLQFTPERKRILKSTVKAAGLGQQGRTRSVEEKQEAY